MPEQRQLELISWAHTAIATGHPGAQRTCHLLQEKYWWLKLLRDVQCIMSSCSTYAQHNVPRTMPAGKLNPRPVPVHPWSHLTIDFITDLPESQGNTTILAAVGQFSKSLHLIPLLNIPSVFTTADLLFPHMFRYFGIPEEIVSDRGPQFTSQVWFSFMDKIGTNVNLTSG